MALPEVASFIFLGFTQLSWLCPPTFFAKGFFTLWLVFGWPFFFVGVYPFVFYRLFFEPPPISPPMGVTFW